MVTGTDLRARWTRPSAGRVIAALAAVALLVIASAVVAQRRDALDGTGSSACGRPTVRDPAGGVWRCTFADNFDGTRLDRTKWQVVRTAQYGFHSGAECYVDDGRHVAVRGGYLRLTVTANGSCPLTASTVESGMVSSQGRFAQRFGRFEIRADLPGQVGLQPALWMYPQVLTYGPWPRSGELDIAEVFGVPGQAWPHLHYQAPDGVGAQNGNACQVGTGFHTYAVDWTPTRIRFTYDGRTCLDARGWPAGGQTGRLAPPAPFDKPFFLLLELALGVTTNSPNAATPLPSTMRVDFVRVWG